MPRPPRTIVPIDPEHQPHIRKFVTDSKKSVWSALSSGKVIAKVPLKKRRRKSTGETKSKNQKKRPILSSESTLQTDTASLSLATMMSNTTLNPVISPGTTMLQEIKNMEERLKLSMKENREKEINDMEIKMKAIIENTVKESFKSMNDTINNTIVNNPVIQSNIGNISVLKEENSRLNREIQYLSAEQAKLKVQLTKLETRNLENMLIIRGIREEPRENEEMCCEKIYRELANTISGSDPEERFTTAKTLTIRKCRRLGKFKRDRIRPISVEFVHKEDRTYILENRSYLNEGIYADKEYPVEVERIRRSLLPILRAAKKMDKYKDQSRMNYDKVVIQGKDYSLNNLHELPEDLNAFKVSSKSTEDTVGFFGEINPLSNFHPAKFIVDGQEFISSEQYIQATKAHYFNDLESYQKIMGCKTSFDCKQMAWSIKDVDGKKWDAVARPLCEKGIREKFLQNPHLMKTLIEKTSNKTIVECANDRLWGNGKPLSDESCLNKDVWITQGILGQILEMVRAEFAPSQSSIPTVPSDSSMRYLRPPPSTTYNYNSNPLHSMTSTPAVFQPTQVPSVVVGNYVHPSHAVSLANTTLTASSSIASANYAANPFPDQTTAHVPNAEDHSHPLITPTPSNANSTEDLAQSPMVNSQLAPEDMDTAVNSIESNA